MKRLFFFLLCSFFSFSNALIPHKVVICGVCKDESFRLPYSIQIIDKIGALFLDYRVVVYENNSTDTTPKILKEWENCNARVHVISEKIEEKELKTIFVNRLDNHDFFGPECIARARNIVLDAAVSEKYRDFEYLIWMDMDFKLEPSYEAFSQIFEREKEWDAVFAYGIDPSGSYWDWYALRDHECPIGSELLGNDWWYLPKSLNVTQNDWYPVYSAFGGCGIYKKASIKGCRYSAFVTPDLAKLSHQIIQEKGASHPIIERYLTKLKEITKQVAIPHFSPDLDDIQDPNVGIITPNLPEDIVWRMSSFVYKYPSVCEHVPFHASMIINGHGKLFINPRFLFRYGLFKQV